jgi:acyl carrier protein phosphodiesterase
MSFEECQSALQTFLESSQGNLTPSTSSRVVKAREKLKKLTTTQFSDLSTDVYDEMKRREINRLDPDNINMVKFLPSQPNYHPKRNQARQKLAALPPSRFKDLVNDVLFEINNRMKNEPPKPLPKKNNGLVIDIEKSNNYNPDNDPSNHLNIKTPIKTPITPSQREIKPTTLVPNKSELTWSSDEEDDGNELNGNNEHVDKKQPELENLNLKFVDKDAINRSPSKRYTIATNEVLNEHAPPDVEFPVDNEDDSHSLKLKINELESKNNEIDILSRKNIELEESLKLLKSQYFDYDDIKEQLEEVKESYLIQKKELDTLKLITKEEQDKQLSTENSREIDTLKTYLDKVLEDNEELKIKVADLTTQLNEKEVKDDDIQKIVPDENIVNELENLKFKHDKLIDEHETLNKNYSTLEDQFQKLSVRLEDYNQKALTNSSMPLASSTNANGISSGAAGAIGALIGSGAATTAIISTGIVGSKSKSEDLSNPNDNAQMIEPITPIKDSLATVSDWQNKFELLRSNQLKTKLESLNFLPKLNEKKLFSADGLISVEKISNVYASLETILIYLDSISTDPNDYSLVNPSEVDPNMLFERISSFVSHANSLSREISLSSNDKLFLRVEEHKRVLKNSISNVLSTTRHFASFRHILPKLVLNAAINDVYFAVCSLVALVKIYSENSTSLDITENKFNSNNNDNIHVLTDNANITSTPIALKTIDKLDQTYSQPNKKGETINETNVRPLRITQRLASNSINPIDNNNTILKPTQPIHSRSGSPMILNSSILPVIVASTDDLTEDKISPIKIQKSANKLSSKLLEEASNSEMNGKSNHTEIEDKSIETSEKEISTNGSKVSSSSLASKLSLPEDDLEHEVKKNGQSNKIQDKMKKFEDFNDSNPTIVVSSPESDELKKGNDIKAVAVAVADAITLDNVASEVQTDNKRIANGSSNPFIETEAVSLSNKTKDEPTGSINNGSISERRVESIQENQRKNKTEESIESNHVLPDSQLKTTDESTAAEDDEDFNNYGGSNKSKNINGSSIPSSGSALDIDEKLVKRVSRRESRRISRVPLREEAHVEGWQYNGEGEEEEEEEEEDFDIDKFNTLNPDNTLRELLLYLEHQTVEVIKAIQQTLQSIRDPKATKGLLRIGAEEINSVVKQMAEGTSTLMNQSRYSESMGHAKYVVGVLEDCVLRMEGLYSEDKSKDGDYAGKSFKQRSAGIAFDVARSTKELVKTVEEASLRDEIAVLDSRLRN